MRHVWLCQKHDREDRRFLAAVHGMELQDGHSRSPGRNRGRLGSAIDRMRARRGY